MIKNIISKHSYKNPEEYSQHNKLQFEFAMEALKSLELNVTDRILDLGCGDGSITSYISDQVSKGCVIGTDVSQEMIDHANVKYSDKKNLGFMQMDASKNVFQAQFDVVTSFNCLHWVKSQEDALTGIANAATDNAKILILLSHKKSLYHLILDKVCSNEKWKMYFKDYVNPRSFFTLASYKEMLINANLHVIDIVEKEMAHNFESSKELKKFFSSSMSQVTHLPKEKREEFLTDFTKEFEDQLKANGITGRPVIFWCLRVNATKPLLGKFDTNLKAR